MAYPFERGRTVDESFIKNDLKALRKNSIRFEDVYNGIVWKLERGAESYKDSSLLIKGEIRYLLKSPYINDKIPIVRALYSFDETTVIIHKISIVDK